MALQPLATDVSAAGAALIRTLKLDPIAPLTGEPLASPWSGTFATRPRGYNWDVGSWFGVWPKAVFTIAARQSALSDAVLEHSLLRWNGSKWRKERGWHGNAPLSATTASGTVLIASCGVGGCRVEALAGPVRQFTPTAAPGCGTQLDIALDLSIAPNDSVRLLGLECETRHLLVESWLPGERQGRVERLPDHVIPDSAWYPSSAGLSLNREGVPWVWGLAWFWGGAADVVEPYLARGSNAGWVRDVAPECQQQALTGFAELNGMQWASCACRLYSRGSNQAWQLRLEPDGCIRGLEREGDKLLGWLDGNWWLIDPHD